jgi:hypothetical protein
MGTSLDALVTFTYFPYIVLNFYDFWKELFIVHEFSLQQIFILVLQMIIFF